MSSIGELYIVNIGQAIKAQRELNNWTQMQLAEKTGISRAAISKYETNDREPDIRTLIVLANVFQVSLDELVGRD